MALVNNSNTYLRRDGGDSGMLNDLQMNQKRITNTALPENGADVVNLCSQQQLGKIIQNDVLPRMTSNSSPFPYTVNSNDSDPNVWKICGSGTQYTPEVTLTTITFVLGAIKTITGLFVDLVEGSVDFVVRQNNMIAAAQTMTVGSNYISFDSMLNINTLVLEIIMTAGTFTAKNLRFLNNFLRIDKPIAIGLPVDATHGVNDISLANAMAPYAGLAKQYLNAKMTGPGTPSGYSVTSTVESLPGFSVWQVSDFDINTNFRASRAVAQLEITIILPTPLRSIGCELALASDTPYTADTTFNVYGKVAPGGISYSLLNLRYEKIAKMRSTYYWDDQNTFPYNQFTLVVDMLQGSSELFSLNCFNIIGDRSITKNLISTTLAPLENGDLVNKLYVDRFMPTQDFVNYNNSFVYARVLVPLTLSESTASLAARTMQLQPSNQINLDLFGKYDVDIVNHYISVTAPGDSIWLFSGECNITRQVGSSSTVTASFYEIDEGAYFPVRLNVIDSSLSANARRDLPFSTLFQFYQPTQIAFVVTSSDGSNILNRLNLFVRRLV